MTLTRINTAKFHLIKIIMHHNFNHMTKKDQNCPLIRTATTQFYLDHSEFASCWPYRHVFDNWCVIFSTLQIWTH